MKKLTKIAIAAVLIVMCVCVIVGIFGPSADETEIAPPEPTAITLLHGGEPTEVPPTSTPFPTATPRPIAPPFSEISAQVESMTEAQWKAYLPTLAGNSVIDWTGRVYEVNVKFGGGYELWVDMDSPQEWLPSRDVIFDIPDDIALEFEIDQVVVFSGVIDHVQEFLGSVIVYLENVYLEN